MKEERPTDGKDEKGKGGRGGEEKRGVGRVGGRGGDKGADERRGEGVSGEGK